MLHSIPRTRKAGPGAFAYGPRGIPHRFAVEGDAPAGALLPNSPTGFEVFAVEAGRAAEKLTLPTPEPPDLEKLAAIAPTYDIEIPGPLPGR